MLHQATYGATRGRMELLTNPLPSSFENNSYAQQWGGDSLAEHPGYGFYGQGTGGDLNHHNVKIVVNKVTKLAKGTQNAGIILVGQTDSKEQHHKINYASVSEEQRMVSCCGVVATHDRWAMHSKHACIRAIVALLPARAPNAANP